MDDTAMMREALNLAQEAADDGEVPVGCVVAMEDGRIVGRGRNRREKGKSALAHAELEAIGEACRTLGGWRLRKYDFAYSGRHSGQRSRSSIS